MAENKKSIIIYADWIEKFEELTNEEAGKLIKHFFRYVNDMNPEAPDRTTKLMFIDIKNTLKRDLCKYESKKEERSKSGRLGNLKRYNKDLYDNVKSDKLTLEKAEELAKDRLASNDVAKLAVNDSVSVSDNVSDINNIYNRFVDEVKLGGFDTRIESMYMRLKLRKGSLTPLLNDFKLHITEENRLHKNTEEYFINFKNWLNTQDRIGKLNEYKK